LIYSLEIGTQQVHQHEMECLVFNLFPNWPITIRELLPIIKLIKEK